MINIVESIRHTEIEYGKSKGRAQLQGNINSIQFNSTPESTSEVTERVKKNYISC